MSLVWVNGTLVDKADARVSPWDHGFLYGDGVWEPLRVFGGKLFRPDDHVKLLLTAAAQFRIDIPLSPPELIAAVEATVRANNRTEGYVRVIVTRGPGTIGPDPRKLDPQVYIIAEEYLPFPTELYGHGLHAVTSEVRFGAGGPTECVRALGQPMIALAKAQALEAGCLEAILLNRGGYVMGATEGNLFAVQNGKVLALLAWAEDVSRRAVLELAETAGLTTAAAGMAGTALSSADELFIAGTSCGVIGVVRVDGQDIGSATEGPITRRIREAYHRLTRGPE